MSWEELRAKYLFTEVDDRAGERTLPLLSVSANRGVVPRSELTSDDARSDDLSRYKTCKARDLVINRMSAYQGAAGVAPVEGLVSPDYTVLRAVHGVDPRFLGHLIRSRWFVGEITARLRGIGGIEQGNVRTPRINTEDLGTIRVRIPSLAEQDRIADFLDAETARIDTLIEKKQRMVGLLEERLRAMVMDALFGADAPWVRVGRAIDLLPGFAFSSDLFSTDAAGGVRLLRGINVAPARTRWDETVHLDASLAEGMQRFALAVGDLVIGMDRPVIAGGMRVAEITDADLPCLLVQRVARLRVNELAERDWIRLALMSPAFVAYFSPIVTGVSVPHISPDQIASFKLPLPKPEFQRSILRRLLKAEGTNRKVNDAAAVQIALLREHRQALVTAAVTGELDTARAAA